jgi:hypothetical protein
MRAGARKERKAGRLERGANRSRVACVSRKLRVHAAAFMIARESDVESEEDRDRRRPRRLSGRRELARFAQIEIEARRRRARCASTRAARRNHRDARRRREGFLRRRDDHVVTPLVHAELRRAEAADRIDERQRAVRATTAAIAAMSFCTPVEVSLCVSKMPAIRRSRANRLRAAFATPAASSAAPTCGVSSDSTTNP